MGLVNKANKYYQRAAWSLGDKELTVADMGFYNTTKEATPIIVHIGWDHTERTALSC